MKSAAFLTLPILVIDDDDVTRKLLDLQLSKIGFSCVLAKSGRAGIEAYGSQEFALVLLDIRMEGMDGFEALKLLRQRQEHTGKFTPIIAVTAYATPHYRELCSDSGFDDFLPKPYLLDALEDVVRRALTAA